MREWLEGTSLSPLTLYVKRNLGDLSNSKHFEWGLNNRKVHTLDPSYATLLFGQESRFAFRDGVRKHIGGVVANITFYQDEHE